MQRTTPTALLLFTLLLPASAHAAKWISIGNKDQARIEVDSTSKSVPGEGRVRIWHRESYSKPTIPDSGAFSFTRLTTLSEFQCDKRLAATLQQNYSAADESELKAETFDNRDVQPVKPDSSLEMVLNYACKRPKPVVVAPPPEPPPPPPPPEPPKKSKGGKKVQEDLPHPPPPQWSYSGNTGPDKWGSLGKEYATCNLGKRQSPIDLRRTVKADLAAIKFAYKAVPLSIVDNGHSIKVDTPDAGSMIVDGESYELVSLSFHKPSEEKINGKSYDMSAHLAHQSKSGKQAVLVVLMEAGKEQGLIRTLWTHLPLEQEKPITRPDIKIDPTLLLPVKRNYITFQGSLTTPPCTEGILWLILKTPIQLSKEQLSSFATVYKNNIRPVQASNNRVIKESR
ncbi:MAG: surface-adhesin E family protein [Betaproteobacteria bacterium]